MEEFSSSELGTKEYWQNSYEFELSNYKHNGDLGEIWFDEDSQIRIINWILKENIDHGSKVIDLGCGNGMFLIELSREGFQNLTGVDYSPNGIELANSIAKDQKIDINYMIVDISNKQDTQKLGKFDIVHDKGTYDAISLNPESAKEKCEHYIENISNILNDTGYFIITSCNWTEEELMTLFGGRFNKYSLIETPSFKFGGKIGNVVTSLVLKLKK